MKTDTPDIWTIRDSLAGSGLKVVELNGARAALVDPLRISPSVVAAATDLLAAVEAALDYLVSGSSDLAEHHRATTQLQAKLDAAFAKATGGDK